MSSRSNLYVAMQLGTPAINLIPADLLPAPQAPREARTIGARTEQLRIGTAEWFGRPRRCCTGSSIWAIRTICTSRSGDRNLTTLADPHSPWKAGDAVSLELVDPLYFNDAGLRHRCAGRERTWSLTRTCSDG